MDPETIVDEIRVDAALAAGSQVAQSVEGSVAVVGAEVAGVSDQLEDHAEASEERHEEILEDTQWLQNQMATLQTMTQGMQSQFASLQTAVLSKMETLETMIQRLLPASNPLTPPEVPVQSETLVVIEPEESAVENPVPATSKKRRRLI